MRQRGVLLAVEAESMIEGGYFEAQNCTLQKGYDFRTPADRRNQMGLTEEQSNTFPMSPRVPTVRSEFWLMRLLVQNKVFLVYYICSVDLIRRYPLRQTYFDQSSVGKKALRITPRQSRNDPC